jgi:hypothetical protein
MTRKPLSLAAMAAATLLLLTLTTEYSRRSNQDGLDAPRRPTRSVDAEPASSRCAIFHARFGGSRAQLVKVMVGSVPNYVVIEVGRRDPLMRRQRVNWLRATYGDGEQSWLGDYGSPEAALLRAAQLCPPQLRCWPGEEDCGPRMLTPSQAFLQGW